MPELLQMTDSHGETRAIGNPALIWYFAFFIISGFCGLVYEVVWVRLAMASFGVTTALVSIVISTFMAGLGLGSWAAGRLSRRALRIPGIRMLRLYAAAEFLVGISSLAVPYQFRIGRQILLHMHRFGGWQSSGYYVMAGAWIALTLVPWCTCMGSTFPLLMAVIRQSNETESDHSFTYLYVANVLGALLGTLISAFILIELFGFQGTLFCAGSLNAILALLALSLSFREFSFHGAENIPSVPITRSTLYGLPRNAALLFLFTTGFVSMGLEVVWIRQFTPYLGNFVYAFAGLLAVYLFATLIGSDSWRSRAARSGGPGRSAPAWSLLAFFATLSVVAADPLLGSRTLGFGLLRLLSIGFFCAMVGYLTPLLVDFWSSGDPDRAGTAYAVNIAGCILGPLIAGFWLLPWVGERLAVAALSIPLFALALLAIVGNSPGSSAFRSRKMAGVVLVFAVFGAILTIGLSHDYEKLFRTREVRRDYTATVIATGTGFGRQLLVNGVGMTLLTPDTKYMAHLPLAFMSRPPRNGLVICFGMGTTFRSMLSWGIPTTAVDLVPSVPALFSYFHSDAPQLLRSPLARVVIDDGRRFLDGSNQKFDVVVVDPPPPVQAAGSSLLYSREFYAVVRKHLRKDGVLQIWYPAAIGDPATTASIAKALVSSFPYVRAFRSYNDFGIHFLAGMEPLPPTSSSVLAARMPAAAAADFVEWGPKNSPQAQFQVVLSQEVSIPGLIEGDPSVPAMSDDQPINEYYLLRSWMLYHR